MPEATLRPDPLTPLLRQRLEISLPPTQRASTCSDVSMLLRSVENFPLQTHTAPPSDPDSRWAMAKVYQCLVAPRPGAAAGPFSAEERGTLHLVHYLHELESAPSLDPAADPAIPRPQSHIHAHLLRELHREFLLLPFPVPQAWQELAVLAIGAEMVVHGLQRGIQPTEVRVVGFQELPPQPAQHGGGLQLHLAAWNGATPPERPAATANPNVWDPNNPLGNELDLLRAPLQMNWIGLSPPYSAGTPISCSSPGAG
ncbi:hypothetical protein ACGFZ3_13790 [Stenotrophomonas sp. NPDC047960]|uniref:hypothetical protein n=1 Tax=Stenotrophomonas sp. NPDC047960 TaxID=3364531 RepID=UPI00371D6147